MSDSTHTGVASAADTTTPAGRWEALRVVLAVTYLAGGLAHLVLAVVAPRVYDGFADQALVGAYTDRWQDLVVPNLGVLVPLVGLFELAVGATLLARGRAVRAGHAGGAVFQAGLVLSGPWGPINAVLAVAHGLGATRRYPRSVRARVRAWRRGD
jgi:hypothetical protein